MEIQIDRITGPFEVDNEYTSLQTAAATAAFEVLSTSEVGLETIAAVGNSVRRIRRIFGKDTSLIAHVNDISLDMRLCGKECSDDEILKGIRTLTSISYAYNEMAMNRSRRAAYDSKGSFDWGDIATTAMMITEQAVFEGWDMEQTDLTEPLKKIHFLIRGRLKWVDVYHRIRTSGDNYILSLDAEFDEGRDGRTLYDVLDAAAPWENAFGLDLYDLTDPRVRASQQPLADFQELYGLEISNLSLINIMTRLAQLPERLRQVMLVRYGYMGFERFNVLTKRYGYSSIGFRNNTKMALQEFARLGDQSLDAADEDYVRNMIAESKEFIPYRMNGRMLHIDSPRIPLVDVADQQWFLASLTDIEREVLRYATHLDGDKFTCDNDFIAYQLGISPGTVEGILTTTSRIAQGEIVSLINTDGSRIWEDSTQYRLIRARNAGNISTSQVASLTPEQHALFFSLTTQNPEGRFASIEEALAKVGVTGKVLIKIERALARDLAGKLRSQIELAMEASGTYEYSKTEKDKLGEIIEIINSGKAIGGRGSIAYTRLADMLGLNKRKTEYLLKLKLPTIIVNTYYPQWIDHILARANGNLSQRNATLLSQLRTHLQRNEISYLYGYPYDRLVSVLGLNATEIEVFIEETIPSLMAQYR